MNVFKGRIIREGLALQKYQNMIQNCISCNRNWCLQVNQWDKEKNPDTWLCICMHIYVYKFKIWKGYILFFVTF